MPVLARTLEKAGLATILVTNMPFWAEMVGTPRTLGVEFPYGHMLGLPGDAAMQRRVILQALEALQNIRQPGEVVHSPERWPIPTKDAMEAWQPPHPSPIVSIMGDHVRKVISQRRKRRKR